MQLFLLLTLFISAAYGQDSCIDAGYMFLSACEGLPTAADAPCGCTCESTDGNVCDGDGDSRCVVASCATDTPNNNCPDLIFGNKCYCSTTGTSATSSTTSTTLAPASKAGKSKGGKSKGGSDGLGFGDCDCENGQIDLTIMYQGSNTNEVGVKCFNRKDNDGDLISNVNAVATGEEFTCTVTGTQYTKLGTETLVVLYDTVTNEEICDTQIHTSCSRDIVGTYGAEGDGIWCDAELIVTGWRDGNNINPNDPTFNDQCDDGFDECPCDCTTAATTTKPDSPEAPVTTAVINEPDVTVGDVCYCSTIGTPATASSTSTTLAPASKAGKSKGGKSKGGKSKGGDGLGFGDCDCENGQIDLTIMYQGSNTNEVGVKCFNRKDNDGDLISNVDSVATGEEFTCTVTGTQYTKLGTETLVVLYNTATNEEICDTQIHTSCSRDIVGTYGAEGDGIWCDAELIVTGWRDGNNINPNDPTFGDECDDGFDECPCTTTTTTISNCPPFVPGTTTCGSFTSEECCPDSYCSWNDFGDGLYMCEAASGVNAMNNDDKDNRNVFETMTNKGGSFYKSIMFFIMLGIGLIVGLCIGVLIGKKCKSKNNYDQAVQMQVANNNEVQSNEPVNDDVLVTTTETDGMYNNTTQV